MRKELYELICERLSRLYETADGRHVYVDEGEAVPEGAQRLVKHVDLWNHNVEFIEQEENWERPAVFVEFVPIRWNAIQPGVEYRAEAQVNLHVVTTGRAAPRRAASSARAACACSTCWTPSTGSWPVPRARPSWNSTS